MFPECSPSEWIERSEPRNAICKSVSPFVSWLVMEPGSGEGAPFDNLPVPSSFLLKTCQGGKVLAEGTAKTMGMTKTTAGTHYV